MCGRFALKNPQALKAAFDLKDMPDLPPRYNIAPTQPVQFAHLDKTGEMELDEGRWWLVPFFHKGPVKDWRAMCTNAKFENGVLEIAFDAPRREQPRSKKIEIR